ncbi:MAG: negative regulator of flagellin synthesis FlgM [Gammaproteobacteria bacterium]|jgi:negative regulator of flagellin synthesis FlgM
MTNSIDSVVDGAMHRLSTRHSTEAAAGKADPAQSEQANDLLDLTGKAKELQTLQHDLAKSPEFDAARVSELKEAIADGRYEVNAERIADKLLDIELKLP